MEYIKLKPHFNLKKYPHLKYVKKGWKTKDGKYKIWYDNIRGFEHLRIRRTDDKPVHNWMHMFTIKNDLLGADMVAVEIFPKRSEFIDGSNTYHIWTWKGLRVPNMNKMYDYAFELKKKGEDTHLVWKLINHKKITSKN